MDQATVIEETRRWIQSIVIGLNLCPFARRVFNDNTIRYVVSEATDEQSLLTDLATEMNNLATVPRTEVETTVLIHPAVFHDFLDYNDFLDPAEHLLETLGHEGVLQLASFHPQYQFGGTKPDDVENHTNRSPYPMLHLLREESITEIADDQEALEAIPERNIETLRKLGREAILEKLREITIR
ncbi:DUF1415 domain-containing protein [Zavarzinella formosa]|uniref:DUF1415 domain-containing protein n=1 Tax=Zavarzinella formosa TaxID=360055 RepID=UPI0002E5B4B0|nr:DUF1415 domain-containing protein [Zavarzinella formosa]